MLHEFITIYRDDIVARTQERVRARPWPSVSHLEMEHGVPPFLTQLSETLRLESTPDPFPSGAISSGAARHGAELLAAGFSVAQAVHDYGDICQAITEIAVEHDAPITVAEFHTVNRCRHGDRRGGHRARASHGREPLREGSRASWTCGA